MKLNANNAETIISNDINIHDYLFKSFEFDYYLKKLKIFIDSPKNDNKYCIEFLMLWESTWFLLIIGESLHIFWIGNTFV